MLDISSFSSSLKIFQEKLDALFKSRYSLAEQGYPIDFVGDGGLVLYELALDEICRILSFIKKHFPQEVGDSELFKFIDDPAYQDIFKKKFYKQFNFRNFIWGGSFGGHAECFYDGSNRTLCFI